MKKKIFALFLTICIAISVAGCSKKITLNLSYGDRTGTYSGETQNGIPNGQGKFTSANEQGEKWTYEGTFKNGHFEGKGKTTWKSGQCEIGTYKDDVIVPLKGDDIKTLFTTPEKYKNNCVELVGKVFTAPEYDEDGVAIQMFVDFKNSENNVIVYINDNNFKVNQNDYLKVTGIVGDKFDGENAFGGNISAPTIAAREYKVIEYKDAAAPTNKEITVNQIQTQFGYSVTVQKVEVADSETRVYVKVDNGGTDKFSLYSFNCKLVQDGKQYEEQDNWDANYPKIQTELLKGNSTEGVIVFPPIKKSNFSLILEGSSENWDETIEPYNFSVVY